jgi:alkanesulfonate monooxygenase SsuD/methylene tetrahydromethanopterin reductase-like flavin-dependent oxidoreductase (luciferase family)
MEGDVTFTIIIDPDDARDAVTSIRKAFTRDPEPPSIPPVVQPILDAITEQLDDLAVGDDDE